MKGRGEKTTTSDLIYDFVPKDPTASKETDADLRVQCIGQKLTDPRKINSLKSDQTTKLAMKIQSWFQEIPKASD